MVLNIGLKLNKYRGGNEMKTKKTKTKTKMEKFDQLMKRSQEKNLIFDEVDVKQLLNKYGPEGLYDLAQELLKRSCQDVSDAINNDPWVCDDYRNSVYNCKCDPC